MRIILLIVFATIASFGIQAQDQWKLRKETDGIKAYTQKHDWSKFDEYRIETSMEGSLTSVLAVFRDYSIYPELFSGFDQIVNHIDEADHYVNYITVKTPFPAKNRDGVYSNKIEYDAQKQNLHIDVSCTDQFYEASNRFIQIKNCHGFWDISDNGDGTLDIVHQFVMDPGGNVPAFIINMQTVKNPIKTIKTLKRLVLLPEYQNREFEILK